MHFWKEQFRNWAQPRCCVLNIVSWYLQVLLLRILAAKSSACLNTSRVVIRSSSQKRGCFVCFQNIFVFLYMDSLFLNIVMLLEVQEVWTLPGLTLNVFACAPMLSHVLPYPPAPALWDPWSHLSYLWRSCKRYLRKISLSSARLVSGCLLPLESSQHCKLKKGWKVLLC